MQWFAQAPANIALIKYMGKADDGENMPANPSLSYTLDHLRSSVVIEQHHGKKDFWEPLHTPGADALQLSEAAQHRYLEHLNRIKDYFNYQGHFIVRSTNNFPHSSGLASSASSFAALTKCAATAICQLKQRDLPDTVSLAQLSQKGSGSSCRSFFAPWAIWTPTKLTGVQVKWMQLNHQVIILSATEKLVSSSEAHQRVKTSPFWAERPQRAKDNLMDLANALQAGDWHTAREICWREFQDMHHLFSTAEQPFNYIIPAVQEALDLLQNLWQEMGDGPIVTMDAGPNIHLLYRPDQAEMALQIRKDHLVGNYDVL